MAEALAKASCAFSSFASAAASIARTLGASVLAAGTRSAWAGHASVKGSNCGSAQGSCSTGTGGRKACGGGCGPGIGGHTACCACRLADAAGGGVSAQGSGKVCLGGCQGCGSDSGRDGGWGRASTRPALVGVSGSSDGRGKGAAGTRGSGTSASWNQVVAGGDQTGGGSGGSSTTNSSAKYSRGNQPTRPRARPQIQPSSSSELNSSISSPESKLRYSSSSSCWNSEPWNLARPLPLAKAASVVAGDRLAAAGLPAALPAAARLPAAVATGGEASATAAVEAGGAPAGALGVQGGQEPRGPDSAGTGGGPYTAGEASSCGVVPGTDSSGCSRREAAGDPRTGGGGGSCRVSCRGGGGGTAEGTSTSEAVGAAGASCAGLGKVTSTPLMLWCLAARITRSPLASSMSSKRGCPSLW
mmetsp:Transcript_66836/g.198879  ORF Transcript_66836/g.198879 Transcript_66836/m.198879 type:complete len:416 (-) Transcript_66836:276-1523(-)